MYMASFKFTPEESAEYTFTASGEAVSNEVGMSMFVLDEDLSIVEGIAFGAGDTADESPQKLDLLYRPTLNDFRGRTAVEAQIYSINFEL